MKKSNNAPVSIPVEKLHPFDGHPFKVLDNEEMDALVLSIQQQGILLPIMVRPKENTDGEYEIISGHRRCRAAIKAGINEVPAFIVELDRDAAAIALVDSNLHRERMLPSEKAFAYKMKMEALSRQGARTDLTSRQVGGKSETADMISDTDSGRQVQRFIRLTNLVYGLRCMVDEGRIAFNPAVELSYLPEHTQYVIIGEIESNDCTPSLSQTCRMKKLEQEGKLTFEKIEEIMLEEKANQKEMFKMPMEQLRKFAPKATGKQMQDFVMKACEHYRRYLIRLNEKER